MLASAAEIAAQRAMTAYFINADPVQVTLMRAARTSNGTGGFTMGTPSALPPQTFKFIPRNHQLQDRQTLEGETVVPDSLLLGFHDADVIRGDWFTLLGARYDVVYVYPKRDYETNCELVFRG